MVRCSRWVLSIGVVSWVCLASAQTLRPEAQLVQARNKWTANRPASYEFTLRFQGNYPPPFPRAVVFRVLDGNSTPMTAINERWKSFFEPLGTIDKVLAFVERELKGMPAEAAVEYDPSLGFPTKVFINPDRHLADDEIVFTVTDFKRLGGDAKVR